MKDVPEMELSSIMNQAVHKPKEDLRRPMLARLADKVRKGLHVNIDGIQKDSNLRRNKLVLEDIVRQRENDQFMDKTSATLFTLKQRTPWANRR